MDEFEEFLSTNNSTLDNICAGLKSISKEEQQLLLLKNQLNKIKKIREEQNKKDLLISNLKEQNALLENERNAQVRYAQDVQEIMSERIHALERALFEKEAQEKSFHEKSSSWEITFKEYEEIKISYQASQTRYGNCFSIYISK